MKTLVSAAPEGTALSRRRFVLGAASTCAAGALSPLVRADVATPLAHSPLVITDHQTQLLIGEQSVNFTGRSRRAITVNNSLPGPLLRWREGQRVKVAVRNNLNQDSSIHWHGIILPSAMDGVPGMSFAGIKPGETFEYEFELGQSGTYWYHSHSHFQEQLGLYGAIIIDPKEPDTVAYDRDMVILLSDWSDTPPAQIQATLKKQSHYYNRRQRTLGDMFRDIRRQGLADTVSDRAMWNQMRMSDTDIADVTGYTYTYLMNGVTPASGWTGLFERGERLRLRIINGSAMTLFDVRIPGLKMTVVAADGQSVQPVEVDEFRIGVAETYDVIVEPSADRAYTVFAQSIDRSGYARGTLTPNPTWLAEIPPLDPPPVLSDQDMGMAHDAGHDHAGRRTPAAKKTSESGHDGHGDHLAQQSEQHEHDGRSNHANHNAHQNHSAHGNHARHSAHQEHASHANQDSAHQQHQGSQHVSHSGDSHAGHGVQAIKHDHMTHVEKPAESVLAPAGFGINFGDPVPIRHAASEFGPQVDMRTDMPASGITDPGVGLRDHQALFGRRVLTYADLRGLHPTRDKRQPGREIELHLTGNMHRYMWSVDGIRHADAEPIILRYGERVRFILVNDTMMTHPFHLHGLWSELETGDPDFIPRKHTVLVQPGSKVSYLVTADAKGRWAYHCHLLYHMGGMMREVRVI